MTRKLAPTLVALLCLATVPAFAEDKPDAEAALKVAQKYVLLGQELFKQGDYERAVRSFRDAEVSLDRAEAEVPAALYRSLARCYDQMGQVTAALGYYKKFLNLAPETTDNPKLAKALKGARDAEVRLRSLFDRTALEFKVEPEGAEVRVDQRVVGTIPLPKPVVPVSPGSHQITIWAEGYEPVSVDLDVAVGATVPVLAKLHPATPEPDPAGDAVAEALTPSPADGPSDGGGSVGWTPIALGAGGIAIGVAGALVIMSGLDQDEAADKRGNDCLADGACDRDAISAAIDPEYDEAGTKKAAGLGTAIVGVGLIAGAVWLWAAPVEPGKKGVSVFAGRQTDTNSQWLLLPDTNGGIVARTVF